MKPSHFVLGAGVLVLGLDIYAQATVSTPIPALDPIVGQVRSLYAPLDNALPLLPLWAYLGAGGVALMYFGY